MQVKQLEWQAGHELPERYLLGLHDRQLVDSDPLQVKQVGLQAKHELPERYLPGIHDRQLAVQAKH